MQTLLLLVLYTGKMNSINKFPLTLTSFIGVLFLLCFCCFVYIPELSCLLLLNTEFKSPKPDLWREKEKKNSNFM